MHYKRRTYYFLFVASFAIFWFLFKLGGIHNIRQAITSTLVDVSICLISLLAAAELLVPKYIYKNRYALFGLLFGLLVITAATIIILSQLALIGSSLFAYQKVVAKYDDPYDYWFNLIFGAHYLVGFTTMSGCAMRLAFDRIVAKRRIETLEKEKIFAELVTLKDQINPHFLFNALNTVYYEIDRSNLNARKTLEQFSALLRYQLYECDHAVVPIEHEIEFLSNYIHIQSRRLNGNCQVSCQGFEEVGGFKIVPFLLAPLIENCFKHVSRLEGCGNFIDITCKYENNWFVLETINSISKIKGSPTGGIGLDNVRKRLKLTYEEQAYYLAVVEKDYAFKLILKLKA